MKQTEEMRQADERIAAVGADIDFRQGKRGGAAWAGREDNEEAARHVAALSEWDVNEESLVTCIDPAREMSPQDWREFNEQYLGAEEPSEDAMLGFLAGVCEALAEMEGE